MNTIKCYLTKQELEDFLLKETGKPFNNEDECLMVCSTINHLKKWASKYHLKFIYWQKSLHKDYTVIIFDKECSSDNKYLKRELYFSGLLLLPDEWLYIPLEYKHMNITSFYGSFYTFLGNLQNKSYKFPRTILKTKYVNMGCIGEATMFNYSLSETGVGKLYARVFLGETPIFLTAQYKGKYIRSYLNDVLYFNNVFNLNNCIGYFYVKYISLVGRSNAMSFKHFKMLFTDPENKELEQAFLELKLSTM